MMREQILFRKLTFTKCASESLAPTCSIHTMLSLKMILEVRQSLQLDVTNETFEQSGAKDLRWKNLDFGFGWSDWSGHVGALATRMTRFS